jgi:acyl carrier protein
MHLESAPQALRDELKAMLVETLMLPTPVAELTDEQPLFGPGGLGLDSVDALQLVVALDKHHGLKLTDAEAAKHALRSVAAMAEAVTAHRAKLG